jgi:hypothetical protein
VIITTIGLGKSKKIPPPESIEGGFVKPPEDNRGDTGEGGFVTEKSEDT